MLKKQFEHYITTYTNGQSIPLFEIEQSYAEKHQLLPTGMTIVKKELPFHLIERCDKETEDVIRAEEPGFLQASISYLKEHPKEFLYVESGAFDLIRVDAIAVEFDEVFETNIALLGLRLPKKFGAAIQSYMDAQLHGHDAKFNIIFSGEDGLWEVNFALDAMEGFTEDLSLENVYELIYHFVFKLVEAMEVVQ